MAAVASRHVGVPFRFDGLRFLVGAEGPEVFGGPNGDVFCVDPQTGSYANCTHVVAEALHEAGTPGAVVEILAAHAARMRAKVLARGPAEFTSQTHATLLRALGGQPA